MLQNSDYYHFEDDLVAYPDAWCYVIFGGRHTGKTYSALKWAVLNKIKFCYIKRTDDDIKLLCTRQDETRAEFSPFKSLNRDMKWNIKAFQLNDHTGIFSDQGEDGKPTGELYGYILSASSAGKYKGFDLSDCDWMIFDEFVPKVFDRVYKNEGDSIMELYGTISRDRELRDREALKLICLANADNAASPLTNTLEITDNIVEMAVQDENTYYIPDRYMLIRKLKMSDKFMEAERNTKVALAMKGTKWGQMAQENEFGYNDFSQIHNKINLKYAEPLAEVIYKRKKYYLYIDPDGIYKFSKRGFKRTTEPVYDLDKEADSRLFYVDFVFDIQQAAIEHRAEFESYTLSRLIYEYKKYFII